MALPEFLDNLNLWEERFPDLHDYAGIRQRIEDARAGRIGGPEALNQFGGKNGEYPAITDDNYLNFFSNRIGAQEKLSAEISEWNRFIEDLPEPSGGISSPQKMLGQTPLVLELIGKDKRTGIIPGQGGIYATSHLVDRHHPQISKSCVCQVLQNCEAGIWVKTRKWGVREWALRLLVGGRPHFRIPLLHCQF